MEIIYGDKVVTNEAIEHIQSMIEMRTIVNHAQDELEFLNKVIRIIEKEYDEYAFYYKDVHCIVWRNPLLGALNGYVQHNMYKDIKCYNGISYGNTFDSKSKLALKDKLYIGFHCAEMYDFQPFIAIALYSTLRKMYDITYKDFNFVMKECMSIVDQLVG